LEDRKAVRYKRRSLPLNHLNPEGLVEREREKGVMILSMRRFFFNVGFR
jgi:hypothetical protein